MGTLQHTEHFHYHLATQIAGHPLRQLGENGLGRRRLLGIVLRQNAQHDIGIQPDHRACAAAEVACSISSSEIGRRSSRRNSPASS